MATYYGSAADPGLWGEPVKTSAGTFGHGWIFLEKIARKDDESLVAILLKIPSPEGMCVHGLYLDKRQATLLRDQIQSFIDAP